MISARPPVRLFVEQPAGISTSSAQAEPAQDIPIGANSSARVAHLDVKYGWGRSQERRSMSVRNGHQVSHSQAEDAWTDYGSDFVLIAEGKPPPRIELARERMLICRLYLGLMRTITDDYGAEFAAQILGRRVTAI